MNLNLGSYNVPFHLFFFSPPATPAIYTLSLHDALPISVDETLEIAERRRYPVVSGHTHFQELAWQRQETASVHKCSSEFFKTKEQVERIRGLGGMVEIGRAHV